MNEPKGAEPKFKDISPVIPVSDVASALAFYCEALGFKLGWTWGDPPTHASVGRGRIDMMLALNPARAGNGDAYVGLDGVDAYFAELQSRKLVLGDLADRPYGMRDFSVRDPNGNRLVFGESIVK
jgi:catechol 2,3-dioxygenase-like lactoylglutathione lyase family enzyme